MWPPFSLPTGPAITNLWLFLSYFSFSLQIEAQHSPDKAKATWAWLLGVLKGSTGTPREFEGAFEQYQANPSAYPSPTQVADILIALKMYGIRPPADSPISGLIRDLGL